MTSYWELLKDPRWQRKRIEVMQRENFTCQDCGETTKTLHVHHTYYAKGRKPWEYNEATLRCLCEDCHSRIEDEMHEIRVLVGQLDEADRAVLRGFLRSQIAVNATGTVVIEVNDYNEAVGVADYFGLHPSTVDEIARANDGFALPADLLARASRRLDLIRAIEGQSPEAPSGG